MTRKLNILYITPECTPFAHSGGLGEVAGSLPGALCRLRPSDKEGAPGIDCRVFLPLYKKIKETYMDRLHFLGSTEVQLNWRRQYLGIFSMKAGRVTYYFADNEYYFGRDRLYGEYDDGERFAFFSKAVYEALPLMDFVPDILHANDWQTALVPVLQQALYHRAFLKTVYTIHNIEYQGFFGSGFYDEVLALPEQSRHLLEFKDGINFMKGGIECADHFSTVSTSYAEELKDPANAFGLDGIIRRNAWKLSGILNGIDTRVYDPAEDPMLRANYTPTVPDAKEACKQALQEELGLPVSEVLLITMVSRLVPAKGMDLLTAVLDRFLSETDAQFVLLGTGESQYEDWFRGLAARFPDRVRSLISFDVPLSHRIYAGGDLLLVPSRSEPCGLTQMIGCRYGDVPLVRATGGLRDSIEDCTLGHGSGFLFERYDAEELHAALHNAYARYQNRENWRKLVRYDLGLDFGWNKSAKEYRRLYTALYPEGEFPCPA